MTFDETPTTPTPPSTLSARERLVADRAEDTRQAAEGRVDRAMTDTPAATPGDIAAKLRRALDMAEVADLLEDGGPAWALVRSALLDLERQAAAA